MIPKVMASFLDRASVGVAAIRDVRLTPRIVRVVGWSLGTDGETLTCLIGRGFVDGLRECLEDNGRFAATFECIGPHETYQFKGDYVDMRPVTPDDSPLYERCSQRFVDDVRRLHGDRFGAEDLRRNCRPPELAIRFRVREIFVQTPGPAAGRRLYPPEDL